MQREDQHSAILLQGSTWLLWIYRKRVQVPGLPCSLAEAGRQKCAAELQLKIMCQAGGGTHIHIARAIRKPGSPASYNWLCSTGVDWNGGTEPSLLLHKQLPLAPPSLASFKAGCGEVEGGKWFSLQVGPSQVILGL